MTNPELSDCRMVHSFLITSNALLLRSLLIFFRHTFSFVRLSMAEDTVLNDPRPSSLRIVKSERCVVDGGREEVEGVEMVAVVAKEEEEEEKEVVLDDRREDADE